MFLLNSCLDLFTAAGTCQRPFSRSYGAFLPSSLTMLLPPAWGYSPCLPVSVCGTGPDGAIVAFLGDAPVCFPTLSSVGAVHAHRTPGIPCPAHTQAPRPHSSVRPGRRNLRLLSIAYASPPRLRPRLPQGRQASPWKPQVSGRGDSHPTLATHSGILPPCPSTAPYGTASAGHRCSPTECTLVHSHGFGDTLQPRAFSAQGHSASELLRTL